MSLSEMRRALETSIAEEPTSPSQQRERPKSRLPPEVRGVSESRSCIVEMNLGGLGTKKMGTLTFANTVGKLKRAGSSRGGDTSGLSREGGIRRAPPRRAQSCMDGGG
jgi:hypothetical protein